MGLCASVATQTSPRSTARETKPQKKWSQQRSRGVSRQLSKGSLYRASVSDELFNPIKPRNSSLHLATLLETELLRNSFAEYVKSNNSEEYSTHRKIDFWLDSLKYERMPYDPPNQRLEHAQYMYDAYFLDPSTACNDLDLGKWNTFHCCGGCKITKQQNNQNNQNKKDARPVSYIIS